MSRRGAVAAPTLPTTRDGRPILSRATLDQYDHAPQRSGGRERFYCPLHGGDNQRSLSVDPSTGQYTCHACGATGTLREHWPDAPQDGTGKKPPKQMTLEEMGRRELAARAQIDQEHAARLAGEIPAAAMAFLAQFPVMQEELRQADCPGAAYLRTRGLDPLLAADLGAGYAAPNVWPGDRGRKVGRLVCPLADPATGRVVSAVGRLCMNADPDWPEDLQASFKTVKQRKLAGCPAGVWPYSAIATAKEQGRPLVVVEGPADVLALAQAATEPLDVMALLGTANVLTAAAVKGLVGVVLALDDDAGGSKAARAVRADLAIAGVPVQMLPAGWLGACGASDPADLASATDGAACYAAALAQVLTACRRLRTGWNDEKAVSLLTEMYRQCVALTASLPEPCPTVSPELDDALAGSCEQCDWPALQVAVEAYLRVYMRAPHESSVQHPICH